jgi:hypothetical protein
VRTFVLIIMGSADVLSSDDKDVIQRDMSGAYISWYVDSCSAPEDMLTRITGTLRWRTRLRTTSCSRIIRSTSSTSPLSARRTSSRWGSSWAHRHSHDSVLYIVEDTWRIFPITQSRTEPCAYSAYSHVIRSSPKS